MVWFVIDCLRQYLTGQDTKRSNEKCEDIDVIEFIISDSATARRLKPRRRYRVYAGPGVRHQMDLPYRTIENDLIGYCGS